MRHAPNAVPAALTWIVLALQAALLIVLAVDASDPPRGSTLFQDLWALSHKPSFYPLVGLAVVGPPATYMAWTRRGRHRWLLLLGWAAVAACVYQWHGHRLAVMLRVLWDHGTVT